jgi:hypothetical protein
MLYVTNLSQPPINTEEQIILKINGLSIAASNQNKTSQPVHFTREFGWCIVASGEMTFKIFFQLSDERITRSR